MTVSRPRPKRRADAERSIASIVEAALACLSKQPDASMSEIARAAGVGRVTLYAHFPSREALIETAVESAITQSNDEIDATIAGDQPADDALRSLIRSSWRDIDQEARLFEAAQRALGAERLRELHGPYLAWLRKLVQRGRREGVFRKDLPVNWQVTTIYSLFHAAAEDIPAGRLRPRDAARVLEATILPALLLGDSAD